MYFPQSVPPDVTHGESPSHKPGTRDPNRATERFTKERTAQARSPESGLNTPGLPCLWGTDETAVWRLKVDVSPRPARPSG